MQELKQLIQDLGDDPYKILTTDPKSDPGVLRKNYRNLAVKYHPDKNEEQSAKLMFLKVNQAYQYLQKQENRKIYQQYINVLQEQKKKIDRMDEKRKKFAQDLKRRQQQHLKTQTQIQKQLKKRKQFFKRKMEQNQERQSVRKQVFDSIGVQQYYQLVASFQVSWNQGLSFTQNMLKSAFQKYGKIKNIVFQPKRNRATITFTSIQNCTQLVQTFRHPLINVRFHLEKNKREHLLKALNKQNVEKIDLSFSTQNIERLKEIINRGSGLYRANYNQIF